MSRTCESRDVAAAFYAGRRKNMKRTRTDGEAVVLHNSTIAWRDNSGVVWLSLCGWPTVTTRDRLNAVLQAYGADFQFCQRKGEQYLYHWKTGDMRPVGCSEAVPLAGPLGMMALEAGRKAA